MLLPFDRKPGRTIGGLCYMLIFDSHANAHCIMKVLKGTLKETRFHWPTTNLNNGEARPLEVQKETVYHENEVTYMSDKLGLHKISNPDPDTYAVSLHRKPLLPFPSRPHVA